MYYDIFVMITRSFGCSPNLSVEMLGFWTTGGRPMVDRCPVDIYCQWFGRGKTSSRDIVSGIWGLVKYDTANQNQVKQVPDYHLVMFITLIIILTCRSSIRTRRKSPWRKRPVLFSEVWWPGVVRRQPCTKHQDAWRFGCNRVQGRQIVMKLMYASAVQRVSIGVPKRSKVQNSHLGSLLGFERNQACAFLGTGKYF